MVRVSIPILIISVVGYALLMGMILLVLDKYLDMRVIAYSGDATRQATNLLHAILTSSPIVEGGNYITKEKLVLNDEYLMKYSGNKWFNRWEEWEDYNILEYDFDLSVMELNIPLKYEFRNLVFDMNDECYLDYQRIKGYAEMPVSIHGGTESNPQYRPGIASLTLMRTPLSELSFWISQSSLRMREGHDAELLKSIRVGPEVKHIKIDNSGELCMRVDGSTVCKHFSTEPSPRVKICTSAGKIKKLSGVTVLEPPFTGESCDGSIDIDLPDKDDLDDFEDECKLIKINATRSEIYVIIPTV